MRKLMPSLTIVAMLALILPLEFGCSRGTLDPAGVYHGNKLLYDADGVIVDVNDFYDSVESLHARNPDAFNNSPGLKSLYEKVEKERDGKPEPDEALAELLMTRDAYVQAATQGNADALQTAITVARTELDNLRPLLTELLSTSLPGTNAPPKTAKPSK